MKKFAWNVIKGAAVFAAVWDFVEIGTTYIKAEITYAAVVHDCAVSHTPFEKCRFDMRGAF